MRYSKNQQVKKTKKGYGKAIPQVIAKSVIEKQGGCCQFYKEMFGITRKDCEIHHIHGRKNKLNKHNAPNLILLSHEVHYAYHHRGYFDYNGTRMYAEDMKQWFIEHNSKLYGAKEVEQCK